MVLGLTWLLALVLVFEVRVDDTFGRPLVRFKRGNSDEFSWEEISASGRFVSLGVAGGDEESVDGEDEVNCMCFFRLRELYVRWTLEDISLRMTGGKKTRRVSLVLFTLLLPRVGLDLSHFQSSSTNKWTEIWPLFIHNLTMHH